MKKTTRKEFLVIGLSLAAATAFSKGNNTLGKRKSTAKFLTQDGKLVEIDIDMLPGAKRKASQADVKNWINRKSE